MNPFDAPFTYWSRWYGTIDGQICSWSFTAEHVQSAVICEAPYVPRGTLPPTAPYYPPANMPVIVVDSTPGSVPVTVTPEPATFVMMALGVAAVMVARRARG